MMTKIDLTKYYHWHWSIKLISILLINIALYALLSLFIIIPTLTKQHQLKNSIMRIQQSINLYQIRISTLVKLQQIIKTQQQHYCKLAGDNIIYPIAHANLLIHIKTDNKAKSLHYNSAQPNSHKKTTMIMHADASLESLYYFLEALSLKQPQLTWQQLTITPGKRANQYHLSLCWTPLIIDTINNCPTKKLPAMRVIFPNQPIDSLIINGYLNNNGQQQVFISDRSGKRQTINRGSYVAIEKIGVDKLVATYAMSSQ